MRVLAAVAVGCGAGGPNGPDPRSTTDAADDTRTHVTRTITPYAGHATELFDDAVEPGAVGLELSPGPAPGTDPLLRERARRSDAVLRVRVSTVTGKVDEPEAAVVVGVRPLETLAGTAQVDDSGELVLRFGKNSPSLGVLKSFEGRLVGSTLVVFLRAFARSPSGGTGAERGEDFAFHSHVAPDHRDVVLAVRSAVSLDEVAHGTLAP